MKYRCLVFDHDDTVVNSTATIHHPCFVEYLKLYYPGRECLLEEYFLKNFDPGFVPMCREDYGMSDEELEREAAFWRAYVQNHIPLAYPGIRTIMERQKAAGGLVCVVSHSYEDNIRRDYRANGLRSRIWSSAGSSRLSGASRSPGPWRRSCAGWTWSRRSC